MDDTPKTPQQQSHQQNAGSKRKQLSLLSFDKMKDLITSVDIDDPANGLEKIRELWRGLQELLREIEAEPPKKRGREKATNHSLILICLGCFPG
jgi:hypothetical protein